MKNPQDSSVVLMGIVKDIESTIFEDLNRFSTALGIFKEVFYFLVESESSDRSVETLRRCSEEFENFRFVSLGTSQDSDLGRTEKMAIARNRYIEELNQNQLYSDVDFVIVSDFNNLNKLLDKEVILSCWENTEWDVCAANQSGHYYDVWALRHDLWSPNDCWLQMQFLIDNGVRTDRAYAASVNSRMIKIPKTNNWIEVESAFGGFAIYKGGVLNFRRYKGLNENNKRICEHVPMHSQLRSEGKRIFINPRLINLKYTDHSNSALIRRRVLRRIKHTLKEFM